MTLLGRESLEVEALRTDRYLEGLLAQRDGPTDGRGAPTAPGVARGVGAETIDPAVRATVDRLGRDLVRVHPSFRFEERLARRLADVAAAMRLPAAAGAEGAALPVPFPYDPGLDPAETAPAEPGAIHIVVSRPLLIGAASAAISIAGAAIVAWRLGRPPADPMTRAVRAAHQLRAAGPLRAGPLRVASHGAGRPARARLD